MKGGWLFLLNGRGGQVSHAELDLPGVGPQLFGRWPGLMMLVRLGVMVHWGDVFVRGGVDGCLKHDRSWSMVFPLAGRLC